MLDIANESIASSSTIEPKVNLPELGFIILRHVNSLQTNLYWQECLSCIREYYPTHPVIIIDDNSDQQYITECKDDNTKVVNSEFPGRGELLPYYYMWKLHPFERAVFVHDSAYINYTLPLSSDPIQFLWYFNPRYPFIYNDHMEDILILCQYMKHSKIIKSYFRSNVNWIGCFGGMSNFTWSAINQIQNKYNVFILLDHITTRRLRMAWERIIAIVVQLLYNTHITHIMSKDIINERFGYNWTDYCRDKNRYDRWWANDALVKTFSGR